MENCVTPFDSKLEELNQELINIEDRIADTRNQRAKYIIENKVYHPMSEYKKAFDQCQNDIRAANPNSWGEAICVELVVKNLNSNGTEGPAHIWECGDGGDCDWPSYSNDGRFYWNTYDLGIYEWSEEDGCYAHWYHHHKDLFKILGFVSVKPDRY